MSDTSDSGFDVIAVPPIEQPADLVAVDTGPQPSDVVPVSPPPNTASIQDYGNAPGAHSNSENGTVTIGSGMSAVDTRGQSVDAIGGPGDLTFLAPDGNDTSSGAGNGSAFLSGDGNASSLDLGDALPSGPIIVSNFVAGLDNALFQGYQGSDPTSQTIFGGSTQIGLVDNGDTTLIYAPAPFANVMDG
jgi:hypothetical protein